MATEAWLVIVGGPNGAGKTTFARSASSSWSLPYLSADLVAENEGLDNWGAEAVRAGRVFIERVHSAVSRGESLLVESTLSGQGTRWLIRRARRSGFRVSLVCLFVDSAEACMGRIHARVERGGHFVPEKDVRRRFRRSLVNFWQQYRFEADAWHLAYNGGREAVRVALGIGSRAVVLETRTFERFLQIVEL